MVQTYKQVRHEANKRKNTRRTNASSGGVVKIRAVVTGTRYAPQATSIIHAALAATWTTLNTRESHRPNPNIPVASA